MQLKNCRKCSIAHILCSNEKKWCNFKQSRTKIRQSSSRTGLPRRTKSRVMSLKQHRYTIT
ncbi:hypothetical protein DN614_31990 [Klebsiella michiganensis]|nr:hypothetical protein DN614_31990 [Klebsiella michiganensis]